MSDDSAGESADELLTLVRRRGFPISRTQLARWHRAGLLPRPVRRHLGRGRGTVSIYPQGTSRRLLALCTIHRHERRLPLVVWKLWWGGDDLPIKPLLERFTAAYQQYMRTIIDDRGLTESGRALTSRVGEERLRSKMLRRMRKRVGRHRFPAYMRLVLETLSGASQGAQDFDDLESLTKGLGARVDESALTWMQDADAYREMSRTVSPSAFRQTLDETTEEDLRRARGELRLLLASSSVASLGLRAFQDLNLMEPLAQIAFLLVWLVFRRRIGGAR